MPGPPRQFDEEEVVAAAVNAFWAHGFDRTRLSTVLEEAGLGRQSLYNAFENKEALYVTALQRYRRDVIGALVGILRGEGAPLERISAVFEALEETAVDGDCDGCFVANAVAEFGRTNDAVLAQVEGSFNDLERAFSHTLAEAKAAGELRSGLDPADLAKMCATLVEGVSLLNRVQDGPGLAESVRKGVSSLLTR